MELIEVSELSSCRYYLFIYSSQIPFIYFFLYFNVSENDLWWYIYHLTLIYVSHIYLGSLKITDQSKAMFKLWFDIHCQYRKFIVYVTCTIDFQY